VFHGQVTLSQQAAAPPGSRIGHLAITEGVELHELSVQGFDWEELFFALTEGASHQPPPPAGPPAQPQGGSSWSV
jgi:hypothetical protein